jgi:hypothetical protein
MTGPDSEPELNASAMTAFSSPWVPGLAYTPRRATYCWLFMLWTKPLTMVANSVSFATSTSTPLPPSSSKITIYGWSMNPGSGL